MAGPIMPPFRGCRGLALTATLAVFLYGCDRATGPTDPSAPTGSPRMEEGAAPTVVQAVKPVLHDAAVRYRDAGHHPARGRSGTAELTLLALAGSDGTTEVRVSTADVSDPWTPAPGTVGRVLAKGYAPGGQLRFATSREGAAGGAASFTVPTLPRGSVVEAQAAVQGVDASRTDVVTVADSVWRRPNLRVAGLTAPTRAENGAPTNLFATVQESNRDLGNWAVCTLYVDGARVDWADRVWVDAGDAVACAFTYRFQFDGDHQVRVRVDAAPGAPRDDDPRDNEAGATVHVFSPTRLGFGVWAFDVEQSDSTVQTARWEGDGQVQETRTTTANHLRSENVFVNAWTPQLLRSPQIRVDVTERSGGQTVYDRQYLIAMDAVDGGSCGYFEADRPGAHIYICSASWVTGTWLFYDRNAYRTTYHSRSFMSVWDGLTGERTVYEQGYDQEDGPGATPFSGDDFALRLRMYDGSEVFALDAAMTLERQVYDLGSPEQCGDSDGWHTCTTTWGSMVFRMGSHQSE
ncbi:MAG TPA: hypothetical protein VFJ82_25665 [Longimicrobium sp.]|nr:hypothetical protein [Longimicrobium sp.]